MAEDPGHVDRELAVEQGRPGLSSTMARMVLEPGGRPELTA